MPTPSRPVIAAALLSAAAGIVHLAAAVPHYGDDVLLGTAFVLTGWAQLGVAAWLAARPTRRPAVVATGVHLAALAAWGVSRTVGLPVGHPGVEPVGLADGVTVLLELMALLVLATLVTREHRRAPAAVGTAVLVGALALGGATAAVADLGTSPHGGGHADDGHHEAAAASGHGDDSTATHAEEAEGAAAASATHAAHLHDDGSVHVHAPGAPHVHHDRTVHVHLAAAGEAEVHTHADGTTETHADDTDAEAGHHDDGHAH